MKLLLTILLIPAHSFAVEDCPQIAESRTKVSVIKMNIANVNTTRTPAGGPYRRQEVQCGEKGCQMIEERRESLKYEPDHVDADERGYVAYPDINLLSETDSLIRAEAELTNAAKRCSLEKVTLKVTPANRSTSQIL